MTIKNSKNQRWAPLILVIVLLAVLFGIKQFTATDSQKDKAKLEANTKGLNRNPSKIEYSRHARCRMECRHINPKEVEQILKEGTINYRKSEIGKLPDCKRKYAVEGVTYEGQKVRIIFAPCGSEVTVVTVIDIAKDWPCQCD